MNHFSDHIPLSIVLFQEGDLEGVNLAELGRYLTEKTLIPFKIHGDIYRGLPKIRQEEVAKKLAGLRVKAPGKRWTMREPLPVEIDYEEMRIKNPHWKIFGILYEGVGYQAVVSELIKEDPLKLNCCFILFTNQLFGTWDRNDLRYHARVSLYGFPNLISISGLVEAPAKPREYYLKKQAGLPVEELRQEFQGRFIDHGDLRMTEVLKGYTVQALFFHLFGDPFCEDPDCRLYNGHWQEEVLHSQINGQYEFCPSHEAILKELREESGKLQRTLAS